MAFVRELKRITLSMFHGINALAESKRVNRLIDGYDNSVVENAPVGNIKTIVFVITRMVRFHGGQTSILRLGTKLEERGYDVFYVSYKRQSVRDMITCAASNLKDYRGKVLPLDLYEKYRSAKEIVAPDVVIATSWDTVSVAKRFEGYKMYFVQDYEPYFYKYGEEFFLSRCTYEQGLHMVSLGQWNKEMITRDCRTVSPIDVISFPCERSEYPYKERNFRDYASKRKLVIAVYLKHYGKRLPNLIPHMIKNTRKRLGNSGRVLEVRYFGEARIYSRPGGKNMGHLSKKQLAKLYQKADFGVVASMSNISLVPYEMLSTGLPVIEFEEGTFPYFFPENCAMLVKTGAHDFAEALLSAISNPKLMEERQKNALKAMEGLGWDRTGDEFAAILKRIEAEAAETKAAEIEAAEAAAVKNVQQKDASALEKGQVEA